MAFQFSEEKIKERISFENPWWDDGKIDPRFRKMKKREYFTPFFKLVQENNPKRAVVLMGPRRVGKTVMIYHAIQDLIKKGIAAKQICFISLDTPIYTGSLLEDLLHLFMQTHRHKKEDQLYIFFDEIQYLKNWEVHLKSLVDSYHHIKFVVSGSAAAALKLKSIESGTGRFTDFILPPLTFKEHIDFNNKNNLIKVERHFSETGMYTPKVKCPSLTEINKELMQYINYGGYPEISISTITQKNIERYLMSDIVDKILLKDLPSLYGIDNIQELKSFFNHVAYYTGQEFSIEKLGNQSGIAKNTIKKYIEYLEASFLIKKLSKIDQNAKTFKRESSFKLYLTNPSLRTALFSAVKSNDPLIGHLIETAVISQLFHYNQSNFYYARWDKGEIDFVPLDGLGNPQEVMEVKWSNSHYHNPSELKSLISFCKKNSVDNIVVTTIDIDDKKNIDGLPIRFIPIGVYCYLIADLFHLKNTSKET